MIKIDLSIFNGFMALQVVLNREAAPGMGALADLTAFLLHSGISKAPGQRNPSLHTLCCSFELFSLSFWTQAQTCHAQGSAPTQHCKVQTNIRHITLSHCPRVPNPQTL